MRPKQPSDDAFGVWVSVQRHALAQCPELHLCELGVGVLCRVEVCLCNCSARNTQLHDLLAGRFVPTNSANVCNGCGANTRLLEHLTPSSVQDASVSDWLKVAPWQPPHAVVTTTSKQHAALAARLTWCRDKHAHSRHCGRRSTLRRILHRQCDPVQGGQQRSPSRQPLSRTVACRSPSGGRHWPCHSVCQDLWSSRLEANQVLDSCMHAVSHSCCLCVLRRVEWQGAAPTSTLGVGICLYTHTHTHTHTRTFMLAAPSARKAPKDAAHCEQVLAARARL
jgi:hypothetical protein